MCRQSFFLSERPLLRTVEGLYERFADLGTLRINLSRVQHIISGPGAASFLEKMTPTSTAALQHHNATLSCFLHPITGGIVDDTVITRLGPQLFYVVTNAACKSKDLAYLKQQLDAFDTSTQGAVDWQVRETWGLVALQGPLSAPVLQTAIQTAGADVSLEPLMFGQCIEILVTVPGAPPPTSSTSTDSSTILVSRAGYTGEDGFEIATPPALTEPFTRHLLAAGGADRVRLAGLGARDSLRLEAGMCLYGHDLDDSTTPVEAGLSWVIGKDRRTDASFHGAETILRQLLPAKEGGTGPERRRVGLLVEGAPAREGATIVASPDSDDVIGTVTSGCPSPTLGKNIAMGYVKNGMHKAGTQVGVVVRGKKRRAEIVKMPFVKARYWKGIVGTAPG